MKFIIKKVQSIIDQCNLIHITKHNVDWLIPQNIQQAKQIMIDLNKLGISRYLDYKEKMARSLSTPYTDGTSWCVLILCNHHRDQCHKEHTISTFECTKT